ncbi:hypothetical protein NDU88_000694 [Pleurodeles waltl]|uniref:Uncharacterized protein n=1 Tax=Pleurodeles waltl TaxID=8319 RepID=A0AAV7S8A8_PLEWA|nr:hypothetical protein NDU88_000694 [Pleurodeles waltl]
MAEQCRLGVGRPSWRWDPAYRNLLQPAIGLPSEEEPRPHRLVDTGAETDSRVKSPDKRRPWAGFCTVGEETIFPTPPAPQTGRMCSCIGGVAAGGLVGTPPCPQEKPEDEIVETNPRSERIR